MSISLSQLFNISTLPPNRRIQALRRVRERSEAHKLDELLGAIDAAIAHDEHALALENTRQQNPSDSRGLDDRIDRTIGMIAGLLEDYGKDTDGRIAGRATELRKELFPQGLQHHVNLPYAQQHVANEHVVTLLEAPENRQWIEEQGLRPLTNRLRKLNTSFGALLHTAEEGSGVASWADIQIARRLGHERMLQVVARIVGMYPTSETADTRTHLLQPILEQAQVVREFRQRHNTEPGT